MSDEKFSLDFCGLCNPPYRPELQTSTPKTFENLNKCEIRERNEAACNVMEGGGDSESLVEREKSVLSWVYQWAHQ